MSVCKYPYFSPLFFYIWASVKIIHVDSLCVCVCVCVCVCGGGGGGLNLQPNFEKDWGAWPDLDF